MHTISVIASILALSSTAISTFAPGNVDIATRRGWCTAEINSCTSLCGGQFNANTCIAETLVYTCTCTDGSSPDLANYLQTIPFFVCQETKNECVAANTTDARLQAECMRDNVCGTIDPTTNVAVSSSSSSAATSATAAATTASTMMVTTTTGAAAASSTSTTPKSGAVRVSQALGLPVFAAAIFVGFQMLL